MTAGEKIFIEYCKKANILCERIAEENLVKTPDYSVIINERIVIIEVKDLTVNDQEKQALSNLEKHRYAVWGKSQPGNRIRNKIKNCSKQLKHHVKNRYAAIMVLYDNRPEEVAILSDYEIKCAMYGFESISQNNNGSLLKRFSSKRQMTEKTRRYISAVGVLTDSSVLSLYLNSYATIPLEKDDWKSIKGVSLYQLKYSPDECFCDWLKI